MSAALLIIWFVAAVGLQITAAIASGPIPPTAPEGSIGIVPGIAAGLMSAAGVAIVTIAFFVGVIFQFSPLRAREMGLTLRAIPAGLCAFVLMWIAFQAAAALLGLATGTLSANREWWFDPGVLIGSLIYQLFGIAPYEELTFRAFLLPQIYARLERFSCSPRIALSIIASQGIFAAFHSFERVWVLREVGATLVLDLADVFLFGVVFAWLYLRSRNLFVPIAFHALSNSPTLAYVANTPYDRLYTEVSYLLCGVLIGALWPQAFSESSRSEDEVRA